MLVLVTRRQQLQAVQKQVEQRRNHCSSHHHEAIMIGSNSNQLSTHVSVVLLLEPGNAWYQVQYHAWYRYPVFPGGAPGLQDEKPYHYISQFECHQVVRPGNWYLVLVLVPPPVVSTSYTRDTRTILFM